MDTPTVDSTNLEILKPSRKPVRAGDIFALRLKGRSFMFGRVIRQDAAVGPFPAILIYVYRSTSETRSELPELRRHDLLVPPIFTNHLPWGKGYFEVVAHKSLRPWDVLPVHTFRHAITGQYLDDHGRVLATPSEPVGTYALESYRTIDDALSDALGIPRVPESQ